MKIIDLTMAITESVTRSTVKVQMKEREYHGIIHRIRLSSMSGTYLDLPGHIKEFDDGFDAANYPVEKFFMVETTVIKLKRKGRAREIEGKELEAAGISVCTPGLLIQVDKWNLSRSEEAVHTPFYGRSAVDWIVDKRITLFISNVYENHTEPRGIFVELFRAGIACVCIPDGLEKISRRRIKICAIPLKIPNAVQLPCRLLAVEDV